MSQGLSIFPDAYIFMQFDGHLCQYITNCVLIFFVSDAEKIYWRATEAVAAKLKDPQVVYMVETIRKTSAEGPKPLILRGAELDFQTDVSNIKLLGKDAQGSDPKCIPCAHFCLKSKPDSQKFSAEVRKQHMRFTFYFGCMTGP